MSGHPGQHLDIPLSDLNVPTVGSRSFASLLPDLAFLSPPVPFAGCHGQGGAAHVARTLREPCDRQRCVGTA